MATPDAAVLDESSLVLKFQAMNEKIMNWFVVNVLALSVKNRTFLFFSRRDVSCPTIIELCTPRGSISCLPV